MELMELMETREEKLARAKNRLEELKGFYWHLAIYLLVNTYISIRKIGINFGDWEAFQNDFWDFSTLAVWFFWGIGLAFHASKVFGSISFFGRNWEEKKILEYLNEDENKNRWK